MNSGLSALGTLLVQRLDAALGTTLAQHAHLVGGARARAVAQPAQAERVRANTSATDPGEQHARYAHQHTVHNARATGYNRASSTAVFGYNRTGHQATTVPVPTPPQGNQTALALSSTARLILGLLAQYPEPAPVTPARLPLWQPHGVPLHTTEPHTTELVQILTQALALAVAHSGLFYESHLADLARGARTPAQLALEPQAHLATSDAPDTTLAPQAALLVRQQLDVLAYQRFVWQGWAWPAAALCWEIQRRATRPETQENASWRTCLRLVLPQLGEIQAQLDLNDNAAALHLTAPACAAWLRAHRDSLQQAYQRGGVTLTQLTVVANAAPDVTPDTVQTPAPPAAV